MNQILSRFVLSIILNAGMCENLKVIFLWLFAVLEIPLCYCLLHPLQIGTLSHLALAKLQGALSVSRCGGF